MNTIFRLSIILLVVISSLFLGQEGKVILWKPKQLFTMEAIEKDLIVKTVESYFDLRYQSFSKLEIQDIEKHVSKSKNGDTFFREEKDKLEVELHNAKIHKLNYLSYNILLDFKEISIDFLNETAKVSLFEGHDVVFESSAPRVSSLRDLHHEITLEKKDSEWKIISDVYEDNLWRFKRSSKLSKLELIRLIDQYELIENSQFQSTSINTGEATSASALTNGDLSYDRYKAAEYADKYALSPNPDYYDYTEDGGDCTNFVSQAIHLGGGAPMVKSVGSGKGTPGVTAQARKNR